MGVRAVVAAGWEVDDVAAGLFADTFYAQMLSGRSFGQALLEARKQTYAAHPDINTWGVSAGIW
ncbi:MAG: CHAT domain-containing protein [Comamonadaceae bacterium]|nr:CHAT domain-containing protein [Comamonadaceae bacterium]